MSRVSDRYLRWSPLPIAVAALSLCGATSATASKPSHAAVKIAVHTANGHADAAVGRVSGAPTASVLIRIQRRLRNHVQTVATRRVPVSAHGTFALALSRYVRPGSWQASAQAGGAQAAARWVERRRPATPQPAPATITPTSPATSAAPAAPTGVVWTADPSKPQETQWSSVATRPHCNGAMTTASNALEPFATETDAAGITGGRAFSFNVSSSGGVCPDSNQRSELGQANPGPDVNTRLFDEGQDRWIAYSVYLPTDFPTSPKTTDGSDPWQLITQWKQLGALAQPALSMHVEKGTIGLYQSNTNDGDSNLAAPMVDANGKESLIPAVTGRWLRFTVHIVFSPKASAGRIEWFSDTGDGMTKVWPTTSQPYSTYTMKVDSAGATVQSHARIGIYRNKQIKGAAHALFGPYVVGETRAAAEQTAFGV